MSSIMSGKERIDSKKFNSQLQAADVSEDSNGKRGGGGKSAWEISALLFDRLAVGFSQE